MYFFDFDRHYYLSAVFSYAIAIIIIYNGGEPTVQEEYERVFKSKVNPFNNVEASTEEIWNQLKTALLTPLMRPVVKQRNGITKGKPGGGMMKLIRLLLKKDGVGKRGSVEGGKEQYLQAKRNAKRTVSTAKKTAEEKKFSDLKPGMDDIFKIAKQLRKDDQDVVGAKLLVPRE